MSNKIGCNFLISVFGTIGAKVMSDLGIKKLKFHLMKQPIKN